MAIRYCSKGDVFLDSGGHARSGGKLNFYITATTTRKNTFSEDTLVTPNANPVVLDSSGRCTADIFLSAADYKVVLTNSDATDSIADDPVHGAVSIITGTVTNDSAAAGVVGEYAEANLASPTALTTATAKTICAVSLTAGDWDVSGVLGLVGAASTTLGYVIGSISSTDNALGTDGLAGITQTWYNNVAFLTTSSLCLPFGPIRKSLSATTSIYMVAKASFAVSTCSAYGHIRARRVR